MFDAVIVGAGFGGLGCALALAERGARVCVLETLSYPGGCASTFTRRGRRHESGATLFSGLTRGQLFGDWIERHRMDVRVVLPDVPITVRSPRIELPVHRDRRALAAAIVDREPERAAEVLRFLDEQRRVADALWALFDDPALLPPLSLRAVFGHLRRAPRYVPVLRSMGRSLEDVMRAHGVADVPTLRLWADATSQITVQASAREAEAPFAMATLDYAFRGTGHVHGGIGELARGMTDAIVGLGSEVRFTDRVHRVRERRDGRFVVTSRRGELVADHVVLNLLPADAARLCDLALPPHLERTQEAVASGWGAVMGYLALRPGAVRRSEPHHLELVADPSLPFEEGNHVFLSLCGEGEHALRTATMSTHVDARTLRGMSEAERAERTASIQRRMRATVAQLAPEVSDAITDAMPGSPRTFARFTARSEGLVGGVPRRVGLSHYTSMLTLPTLAPRRYLVGDSVLLGQSTLATALSGIKVADAIAPVARARKTA